MNSKVFNRYILSLAAGIYLLGLCQSYGCKAPAAGGPVGIATKTPIPSDINGANAGVDSCTAQACPKATDVVLEVNGASGGSVTGQAGTATPTSFRATSAKSPGRQFVVYSITPNPLQSSMTVNGNNTASASLNWTPGPADAQTGVFKVIARDTTACAAQNKANPAQCNDFSQRLDNFDTEGSAPWSLAPAQGTQGGGISGGGSTTMTILKIAAGFVFGGVGGGLGSILGGGGYNGGYAQQCSVQNCGACSPQQCMSFQNSPYGPGCRLNGNYCSPR